MSASPEALEKTREIVGDFTLDELALRFDAFAAAAVEAAVAKERAAWQAKINTPLADDFCAAVMNEAEHQRQRWGAEHDTEKSAEDWFWLIGFLVGKALHDIRGKRRHHIVAAGAALLNWLETEARPAGGPAGGA